MIRRRRAVVPLALLLAALGAAGASSSTAAVPAADRGPTASVIVQADSPAVAGAAVRRAGGRVTADLPIVHGVSAVVPSAAVPALRGAAGVRAVTPNEAVRLAATETLGPAASNDSQPLLQEINAYPLWKDGNYGAGVRVALVDTGVTPGVDLRGRIVPVADPSGSGATVPCVNFSGEQSCNDSYGHGTFIAGLIAGDGTTSGNKYPGVAPRAEIVSIKIAGRDGSADVSKVLAAIQWAVSFKDTYNIKVLNLSLGTDSTVTYRADPLNYAVERAWREGVAVVVAASNRGPNAKTISKPADDPLVITVGALDDRGTPGASDDLVPAFSGRGPTATDLLAKPDVTAPGARVVSLRAPGSLVEEKAPGGGVDGTYRRGSGTSMSAGVVSGAVALIRAQNPTWTPDRVKFALMSTALPVSGAPATAVGTGLIDVAAAARRAPAGLANQGVTGVEDLRGTLEGSRGTVYTTGAPCLPLEQMVDPDCIRVKGDETAQGATFSPGDFDDPWSGRSWYGSQWVGRSWYSSSWYGRSWYTPGGPLDEYGIPMPGSDWLGVWA